MSKKILQHCSLKNTCNFIKDGENIILGSSNMKNLRKPSKGEGNNLLSKSQVEKTICESMVAFASVIFEENEEILNVPLEVQHQEFLNVEPEQIPSSLPPIWSIQHCMI